MIEKECAMYTTCSWVCVETDKCKDSEETRNEPHHFSPFALLLMSFSLPPAETLSIILDEPSLCNQTITFGEESIEVNKFILAAHSTYFRSLWFLEFGDRDENPIDFSHLPDDSNNFLAFIKSFFGRSFTLNEINAYDFYYLVHYFQVDKLVAQVENHLYTSLMTLAWLKPFIKEANKRNDLRALEFVGPFFSKIDDLLIDDVMAISTEGLKTLCKYCTSTQSQSWFVKSMVESILNQSFDLNEFLHVLTSCSIEAFSFQQWDEFLFVPLKDVEELEADLMKFLFTRVKNLYFDALVKENSELKEDVSDLNIQNSELTTKCSNLESNNSDLNTLTTDLTTENHDLKIENSSLKTDIQNIIATNSNEIAKLKQENEQLKKTAAETQVVSQSVPQSKVIRFCPTKKHSELQVSVDRKRVVVGSGGNGWRNILGEDPLLPGNEYTWKLRYQGDTRWLIVGVIDESKFRVDGHCFQNAHCFRNHGNYVYGCLSGNKTQWNPGELLEISVNLINFTLTIKSVGNSSINLTGTLPQLSSGNYFPYGLLYHSDHVLEIVE
ncbi:hypothetical protein GEMRC1_000107 [Eukaryota sp. GEM-RC1]